MTKRVRPHGNVKYLCCLKGYQQDETIKHFLELGDKVYWSE